MLVIAHFDWLPLPGSIVEAVEALIVAHNPAWKMGGGCGIHWRWFADLSSGGFIALESFSFDVDQPYSHEAWRGRIRASAGVAATLDAAAVQRFDDGACRFDRRTISARAAEGAASGIRFDRTQAQ